MPATAPTKAPTQTPVRPKPAPFNPPKPEQLPEPKNQNVRKQPSCKSDHSKFLEES